MFRSIQTRFLAFGIALFSAGAIQATAFAVAAPKANKNTNLFSVVDVTSVVQGGNNETTNQCVSAAAAPKKKGKAGQQVITVTCPQPPEPPQDQQPRPEGLKGVPIPTPSNLYEFITDRNAAIVLGKALFWDMQVGSDGVQACASCHFHAGVDNRSRNSLDPDLARASSPTTAAPDSTFQIGGPNYQLKREDFPFVQFSNPNDNRSWMTRDVNDVVSSQGVTLSSFLDGRPGASMDRTSPVRDDLFNISGANTRRVAARNTPSTINAVFNFRNFWDGRAQFLFNGVNPFGARDESARVYKTVDGVVTPVRVLIDNASLASQAVGPPSSIFEMSGDGRTLMDIGKRLLPARPLKQQRVAPDDSVLGRYADPSGTGLAIENYAQLVRAAFRAEWWNGSDQVNDKYTQMEANFSLFFGLAVQMYESTLVSDDSPFDRYMAGASWELSKDQRDGMNLFFGKGKCANCHGGAEFTNASVRKTLKEPLQRMVMGDGRIAVYDEGFYNTAVRRTSDDILVGGRDPFDRPLSNTALAQQIGSSAFRQMVGVSPNISVSPGERIAVMGAAKTPTVRNAELTQPFFHGGGDLNLDQLMEFYNRGGNFPRFNIGDLDPDIESLKLSDAEKRKIIAFMKSLTDERVRREAAPFDHPELMIPNGHEGDTSSVATTSNGQVAVDELIRLPAVGASGGWGSPAQQNFLGVVE